MTAGLTFTPEQIARLEQDPARVLEGHWAGGRFAAHLAIPQYPARLAEHYAVDPASVGLPLDFEHFGLVFELDAPCELAVYDGERRLDEGLRGLLDRYGTVIFRNAYLAERERQSAQRNIFPSLHFHIDRGSTQPDRVSLFFRDPFDPLQREPRSSSTLILANVAAYLQSLKEGRPPHEFKALYQIFQDEDIDALDGRIMVNQSWSAPRGTGEICLVNNDTVLHASYYARERDKGYPIGVRYLY
jgi:hypothetical protein